ncbi:MAG: TMEM128 family protein [Nanoarchaeota archaeon]
MGVQNMEEKSLAEKIENLDGKEGTIELNNKDRNSMVQSSYNYLDKEHEKKDNLIWLLIGLGIGILGNFITNLIYDGIKQSQFIFQISLILIILFCIGLFIIFHQLGEHKQNIKYTLKSNKSWAKSTHLNVGPAFKPIDIND